MVALFLMSLVLGLIKERQYLFWGEESGRQKARGRTVQGPQQPFGLSNSLYVWASHAKIPYFGVSFSEYWQVLQTLLH